MKRCGLACGFPGRLTYRQNSDTIVTPKQVMESASSSFSSSFSSSSDDSVDGRESERHPQDDEGEDNLSVFLPNADSEHEAWSSASTYNPEINVDLLVNGRVLSVQAADDSVVQDLEVIVSDIFGCDTSDILFYHNGDVLEVYRKLKHLASDGKLKLNVVFSQEQLKDVGTPQNASAQTKSEKLMVSRIIQTPCFPLVDSATNTPHDKQIQVDHKIEPNDKILVANKYVSYETYIQNQHDQAIMIQKSIRRFLAQKRIVQMKKDRDLKVLQSLLQNGDRTHDALNEELRSILERHTIPRLDDFSKAYSTLADWVKCEKDKFKDKKGLEYKRAMNELFKKEMESLNIIQKVRLNCRDAKDDRRKTEILKKASKPARICTPGRETLIEYEDAELANIFSEMSIGLNKPYGSKEDRNYFLQKFTDFLKEFKMPESTNEMASLAEKEQHMLSLGVNEKYLEGMRRRLVEIFAHFSTDPAVNPGIKRATKRQESLVQCRICKELKSSGEFNVDVLQGLTDCTLCTVRRELSHANVSLVPYKALQKDLLSSERELGSPGDYVSLLQPSDFYYLVQYLWSGRSCLSEVSDLKLLSVFRWDMDQEWSPWNCILLTAKEGKLHRSVLQKENFYGPHFIKKIKNKHIQAKIKFKNLEMLYRKLKFQDESESTSPREEIECPMLDNLLTTKTKILSSKFEFSEPISDLIFP